jgi:hypothetical protein
MSILFCFHLLFRDQRRVQILESYCALATRNKVSIERAMQSFVDILDGDQDYLPAILGMATGFMIEKNQVRVGPYSLFVCVTFCPCFLAFLHFHRSIKLETC